MRAPLIRWALLMAVVLLAINLPSVVNVSSENRMALMHLASAGSDGHESFLKERYLTPIHGALLYVPWTVSPGTTSESLLQWAQELAVGNPNGWNEITERSPAYSIKAFNSEWSLLGYDVLAGGQAIRLYWQSPATYVVPPILTAEGDNYTLAVGQRFYQDLSLDRGSISKELDEDAGAVHCPMRKSISGKLVGLAKNPGSTYAIPVAFANRLCFFSVMWPDVAGANMALEGKAIIEDKNEAWVFVTKQTPPLIDPLPSWDFASTHSTLGWESVNGQTSIELTDDGLLVTASGIDASIASPEISMDTRQAQRILATLRAKSGTTIELFWTTLDWPRFDQQMSKAHRLQSHGLWHTYEFDLSAEEGWQGVITRLRLDPTSAPGSVDIASIVVK